MLFVFQAEESAQFACYEGVSLKKREAFVSDHTAYLDFLISKGQNKKGNLLFIFFSMHLHSQISPIFRESQSL